MKPICRSGFGAAIGESPPTATNAWVRTSTSAARPSACCRTPINSAWFAMDGSSTIVGTRPSGAMSDVPDARGGGARRRRDGFIHPWRRPGRSPARLAEAVATRNPLADERHPLATAPSDQFRTGSLMDAAGERLRGIPLGPRLRRWGRAAYHAAWFLQTGGRGLSCTLPSGELIRVLPEHRYLSWNPIEYAASRAAVTPGMIALDIGANVGAYTVLLAQWVGKAGRVYAFEPSSQAFRGLVRHSSLNAQD